MNRVSTICIRRGALHMARDVYDAYFQGLENVVMLRDGDDLVILPVRHAGAGGYVIKLRNAHGDRVIASPDFFRDNGIDDARELALEASWSDDRAALIAHFAFAS